MLPIVGIDRDPSRGAENLKAVTKLDLLNFDHCCAETKFEKCTSDKNSPTVLCEKILRLSLYAISLVDLNTRNAQT